MKFLSIDIETTGLNPDICQIIQIAVVCLDTETPESEWPSFELLVDPGTIVGEPFALAMHAALLKRIAKGEGRPLDEVMEYMLKFVKWELRNDPSGEFTVVGKNFSFDVSFLRKHASWGDMPVSHRHIDIGNQFWRPSVDGAKLPDSKTCFERAFGGEGVVAHTALEDAMVAARQIVQRVTNDYLADMAVASSGVFRGRDPYSFDYAGLEARVFEKNLGKPMVSQIIDETSVFGDSSGVPLPEIDDKCYVDTETTGLSHLSGICDLTLAIAGGPDCVPIHSVAEAIAAEYPSLDVSVQFAHERQLQILPKTGWPRLPMHEAAALRDELAATVGHLCSFIIDSRAGTVSHVITRPAAPEPEREVFLEEAQADWARGMEDIPF